MTASEILMPVYLNHFNKYGELGLKNICSCTVPSMVVLEKYKTILPIINDQLPELMAYAKEIFPEETSQENLLKIAKITHTIGTLI